MKKIFVMLILFAFFAISFEETAFARLGGGGSMGSRGSRSYSSPSRPSPYQSQQTRPATPVNPSPSYQQPSRSGGFFRSMAGGLAGGFLGAMLFRGLGFGGGMGFPGGGGIGLLEIILLAGIAFVIYKVVKSKKSGGSSYGQEYQDDRRPYDYSSRPVNDIPPAASYGNDLGTGLSQIRQFDPSFDEKRFKETAGDIFFRVQAAWMNREIEQASALFAPEIFEQMRSDVLKMRTEGRINRLENIALRGTEITEAWQEQGRDYITVEINANVLDYVTDDAGKLLEGSKTEPVRFLEYWTFVRSIGSGAWRLSAIQQAD